MKTKQELVSSENIENKIFMVRGRRVMLDFQLAELYRTPTKSLNLAVKRNESRFPEDFMFRLNAKESEMLEGILRFQFETSRGKRHGGRRYLPYAFTEQGSGYAFERPAKRKGCPGEHCNHPGVRLTERDPVDPQRTRFEAEATRNEALKA